MNYIGDCLYEVFFFELVTNSCFLLLFKNFKSAVLLMKEAFFKHGEKEALRSCVKALNFCATESRGELQDFALNKLKGIEDELIMKLKSAIKEVAVCALDKLKWTMCSIDAFCLKCAIFVAGW